MPEGDTLYRIAASLRAAFAGTRIVDATSPEPRWEALFAARPLAGRDIAVIEARGKHLLIVCRAADAPSAPWPHGDRLDLDLRDTDWIVQSHLGMHGAWWIDPPAAPARRPSPHSVWIETAAGRARCERPAQFRVWSPRDLVRSAVAKLGPDLTRDAPDMATAIAAIVRDRESEIGEALLRQHVVAGVGNVVKSEALFLAGISPFARVGDLAAARVENVLSHAAAILAVNRERTHGRRTVRGGAAAPRLWVYGRTGKPCLRCGALLESRPQGTNAQRSYWCPTCQPPTA